MSIIISYKLRIILSNRIRRLCVSVSVCCFVLSILALVPLRAYFIVAEVGSMAILNNHTITIVTIVLPSSIQQKPGDVTVCQGFGLGSKAYNAIASGLMRQQQQT